MCQRCTVACRAAVVLIAGGGTGGHLMPALAIAAALAGAGAAGLEPVLVGAVRGVEARILPTRDFRFHLLPTEPIYRRTWWRNFRWPFVAGRLLREVDACLREERPAAVLGTGGYASGPVVWWAARHGIPTAIQEQNAYPGLATPLAEPPGPPRLSRPARSAAAAPVRPEHAGLRHRQSDHPAPPEPQERAGAPSSVSTARRPVVLVTGGSQGALAINRAVAGWLDAGGPGRRSADLGDRAGDLRRVRPLPPAAAGAGHRFPGSDGGRLRRGRSGGLPRGDDHGGRALRLGTPQHPDSAADGRGRSPEPQRPGPGRRRGAR